MTTQPPPWLATQLFYRFLEPAECDAMLGDLFEEYLLRAAVSPQAAVRWYWKQALRSVPVLLGHRARRDRWLSTVAVAVAGYLIVGILNAVGTSLVAPWLDASSETRYIATAIVGLAAIGSGAHLASRMRPAAGRVLGGLVMVVAVWMLVLPVDESPAWYQLTFLILGPLAAQGGAAAAVRNMTTHHRRPS